MKNIFYEHNYNNDNKKFFKIRKFIRKIIFWALNVKDMEFLYEYINQFGELAAIDKIFYNYRDKIDGQQYNILDIKREIKKINNNYKSLKNTLDFYIKLSFNNMPNNVKENLLDLKQ